MPTGKVGRRRRRDQNREQCREQADHKHHHKHYKHHHYYDAHAFQWLCCQSSLLILCLYGLLRLLLLREFRR